MRDPKEGIALAAIVAKETTQGSFSGTGGGLGLGTGGPGVFIGGMTGSRTDQTERAKSLAAPGKASFNSFRAYMPGFVCFGAAAISILFSYLFSGLEDPTPAGLDSAPATAVQNLSLQVDAFVGFFYTLSRYILPPLFAIVGVLWLIFGSSKALDMEERLFKQKQARDSIKEDIYYRLRYVESDHIVFDPVTFREVPAERERIIRMINQLAGEKVREVKCSV